MPTLIKEVYGNTPSEVALSVNDFFLNQKMFGERWTTLTGILMTQAKLTDDGEETTVIEPSQYVCILVRVS